jgi:hypothetical protein
MILFTSILWVLLSCAGGIVIGFSVAILVFRSQWKEGYHEAIRDVQRARQISRDYGEPPSAGKSLDLFLEKMAECGRDAR